MTQQYRIPVEETFSWQRPVINMSTTVPPGSPVKGDRYVVATGGTGDWAGQDYNIAWFDGAIWKFDIPTQGWAVYNKANDATFYFNGTTWYAAGNGNMLKSVYDTDNDGIVDAAEVVTDGGPNTTTAAQVKLAYDSRGVYDSGLGAIIMNL